MSDSNNKKRNSPKDSSKEITADRFRNILIGNCGNNENEFVNMRG